MMACQVGLGPAEGGTTWLPFMFSPDGTSVAAAATTTARASRVSRDKGQARATPNAKSRAQGEAESAAGDVARRPKALASAARSLAGL